MDQYLSHTIFSGLFTSINPSYFDVNYRGTRVLTHPQCRNFLLNTTNIHQP